MLYGIIIGDYAVMGRLSAITMIPNIILLVIGIMGARHSGQKKTYVATVYGCIAVQLAITLLLIFGDPTKIDLKSFGFMNIAFVVLIIALNGIRNIGSNMMIPMMADCTDYEVYRSGHYVPGLIATVYSFIDKLISSFATTVVGAFVAVIGYKNSVPQVGDASSPCCWKACAAPTMDCTPPGRDKLTWRAYPAARSCPAPSAARPIRWASLPHILKLCRKNVDFQPVSWYYICRVLCTQNTKQGDFEP